ncbi:hypothetical protein JJL56_15520 [Azospirillum sp. YIM DDC1]|uniref:DUF6468 domain-containing protein n=1 Tax=Azospirillum aestuarii TaxID=2802052 RepID=A0ABS1HZM2_9PROT|nr:DUF6468 domain-containing protein [Azospirillum aestuarii]MBK3776702.1 hypothetical protein [Azospirillum brasilense]MBK4720279.1 hypothetical protein [Azospirillum aestuarii]TWA88298.1 hypothetical protein FBY14_10856 [Azospirillum brasilense]
MSPTLTLVLDLVMVGLLAATIAYAIILNRQIIKLRESRGEMAELVRGLNEAMSRAETGVRGLKKTAHETGEDLQRTVAKAQTLRDELEFMIEAADAMANRLGNVGGERPKPASAARPAARPGLSARPPVASRPIAAPRPIVEDDHGHDDHDHDDHDLHDDGHIDHDDHDDLPPLRSAAFRNEPLRADPLARRPAPASDPILREGESLSRAERELLQAIENAGKGVG